MVSMNVYPRMLFREPDERKGGLVFIFLSFICFIGLVYFGALLDGPYTLHFFGISLALLGFAEVLPTDRRHLAGLLRIGAISILVGFLVLLASAPELVMN